MVNQAARGRQREWLIRDYLCGTGPDAKRPFPGFGWIPLQRSASSKGAVDTSFIKPGRILLVQVKRTADGPQISPAERASLIHLADTIGLHIALPVTCWWPDRAPLPTLRLITGPGPKDWTTWDPARDLIDTTTAVVGTLPAPRAVMEGIG